MQDDARTWHDVPAIDMREDVYERLCQAEGRARFTAAHELGHLLLHKGESRPRSAVPIKAKSIPASMSSEAQANTFAASFLMPVHVVREFNSPEELSTNCRVSLSAAESRMKQLRLWPKNREPIPEVEEWLRKQKAELKKRS